MSKDEENKRLVEQAIRALQSPWLRPRQPQPAPWPHFLTTFPALDAALGGGVPRGRITEITGTPTSGMVTLALKVLAQAQSAGETVVYLDLYEAFDPDYAVRCGLRLETLWVLRPQPLTLAWAVLTDVILEGVAGAVVVDIPLEVTQTQETGRVLRATLNPLLRAAAPVSCGTPFSDPSPATGCLVPRFLPPGRSGGCFVMGTTGKMALPTKRYSWVPGTSASG